MTFVRRAMTMDVSSLGRIEFGGPDLPPRRLRDLLQAQVDASPAGSRIDWATYYFRDRALAEALIRASDRGVNVTLVLEPNPRRKGANDPVIAMLKAHGLGGGLHLYRPSPFNAATCTLKYMRSPNPTLPGSGRSIHRATSRKIRGDRRDRRPGPRPQSAAWN